MLKNLNSIFHFINLVFEILTYLRQIGWLVLRFYLIVLGMFRNSSLDEFLSRPSIYLLDGYFNSCYWSITPSSAGWHSNTHGVPYCVLLPFCLFALSPLLYSMSCDLSFSGRFGFGLFISSLCFWCILPIYWLLGNIWYLLNLSAEAHLAVLISSACWCFSDL